MTDSVDKIKYMGTNQLMKIFSFLPNDVLYHRIRWLSKAWQKDLSDTSKNFPLRQKREFERSFNQDDNHLNLSYLRFAVKTSSSIVLNLHHLKKYF